LRTLLNQSSAILFLLLGLFTCTVYGPGLDGGFIFDDFQNLEALGTFGGVHDWETLRSYLASGFAGPTGRPLALLSFLIDDHNWPSQAAGFKRTNLLIHLLIGVLLCWTLFRLLSLTGKPAERAAWLAVLAAGFWLLHPYFVSTTLYVVQRMAQLAALFVLAGLLAYLHGRALLPSRPRAAYAWMTAALLLATPLAVLSKENGALLPLLIVVVEFALRDRLPQPAPDRRWQAVFLWLPSLAILGYLFSQLNFAATPWPNRPFNQAERLWSEARIVWEYLYHLLVPRIEGHGLFQDGYPLSTGWLAPPSTLFAALGMLGLGIFTFFARRRWPFISLALLFFLAGHLLESTWLGLELYFEHRNYLPAVFLFLPVALGIEWLGERFRWRVAVVATAAILILLAGTTYQRATLWGDTNRLQAYWAAHSENSPRAQNAIAAMLLENGQIDAARHHLEAATTRLPESALLNVSLLIDRITAGQAEPTHFAATAERLLTQPFDAQAVKALDLLVEVVSTPPRNPAYLSATRTIIEAVSANAAYAQFPLFTRFAPYLLARLAVAEGRPTEALAQFKLAMRRYNETDAALSMVANMARGGYYREALVLLDDAERVFLSQLPRTLKRSPETYRKEITRLRANLEADLARPPSAEKK